MASELPGLLRSRPMRLTAHPVTALLLSTGSLVPLCFTPLYDEMMTRPLIHALVHLHFVASGCLFARVVAGPDPAPRRPSVPARLVVLAGAIALHALEELSRRQGRAGDCHAALERAMTALGADPLRETVNRRVTEVHVAAGNVAEALRQYDLYRRTLRRELGLSPSPEYRHLLAPYATRTPQVRAR